MFHYLKEYLERRLFWIVCQLHTNELKLMRLISNRDGKSNSKDGGGWEGDLGKLLAIAMSLERTLIFLAIPGWKGFLIFLTMLSRTCHQTNTMAT